jgi:hypothetical protein
MPDEGVPPIQFEDLLELLPGMRVITLGLDEVDGQHS